MLEELRKLSGIHPEALKQTTIFIKAPSGEFSEARVRLAESAAERAKGLQGVTDMNPFAGMLFAFPSPTTDPFWMKNTPLPLSIAFFDIEGRFISSTDMEPFEVSYYTSGAPYSFALEVPQGDLETLGVVPGSRLIHRKVVLEKTGAVGATIASAAIIAALSALAVKNKDKISHVLTGGKWSDFQELDPMTEAYIMMNSQGLNNPFLDLTPERRRALRLRYELNN